MHGMPYPPRPLPGRYRDAQHKVTGPEPALLQIGGAARQQVAGLQTRAGGSATKRTPGWAVSSRQVEAAARVG